VHVLIDTDGDGLADEEVAAVRNADGVNVDVVLRDLNLAFSTADCQGLDGKATSASATVKTTLAGSTESFAFTFDPALVPNHLAAFRWAVFGQAPADPPGAGGPWDIVPDAANPDPGAANPGDRRCDPSKSGLVVRMKDGIAFPDPVQPTPTPKPTGAAAAAKPVVVLSLPGGQPQAGTPRRSMPAAPSSPRGRTSSPTTGTWTATTCSTPTPAPTRSPT
jgi:hypothetical protein